MNISSIFKKKSQFPEFLVNVRKTIKLYWEVDKLACFSFFFICIVLGFMPYLTNYFFGEVTNNIVKYLAGENIAKEVIIKGFILVSLLALVDSILWSLTNLARRMGRFSIQAAMNEKVIAKLSDLDFVKYEDRDFNNFMNKVRENYLWKPEVFANTLPWVFYNAIRMIAAIVILIQFAPWILPLILISFIPTFLVESEGSKIAYGIWDTKGDDKRLFSKTTHYLTEPNNLSEIKIFGIRVYLLELAKSLFNKFHNDQKSIIKKTQIKSLFTSLIGFGVVIGIEIWMLFKILAKNANFGLGNFIFYRNTMENFSGSVRDLIRNFIDLFEHNLYMTDLFKLLEMENSIIEKTRSGVKISTDKVPSIEFKNVYFKYPNTDKYIYKNFSLKINPGEDIALVGENGAGKTTFVKLLMRFYDIEKGEILINGVNIKDLNLEEYYKNIGVLFQEYNKYSYSVKENILLGNVEIKDEERMLNASIDSGADKFVKEYKKEYEQMLSKSYENGTEPSGGQWQKIALARAFYRNANILILDEPTSAIDAKAEYEIFKKISEVQAEKTTIIISHRFSTVRNANRIYVVDHGEIIENGTHQELMKISDGKYKEMFEIQAKGYK